MASIASVVTRGYGSFGSANLLPTLGYLPYVSNIIGFGRLEYTMPRSQLEFTLSDERLEFTIPAERLEFTSEEA